MTPSPRLIVLALAFFALVYDPRSGGIGGASAQIGQTPLPQPGMPDGTMNKPEGVAEQAKDDADKLPTTPVLPQDKSRRKRFELVEIDGYYRFRTDWFKNLHLGFSSDGLGGATFPQPLGCLVPGAGEATPSCEESLKSANMRLRLEPTINISETAHVYLQIDVLDNLVLGSTPAGPELRGLTGGQLASEFGGNALRVKRAWAEIETPLGLLTVGRQPWHWGLGIYANGGGYDPFSGTYDFDADHGDTVDRAMFRAEIPGTRLEAAVATDWSSTAPASSQVSGLSALPMSQGWDLEDGDDVNQWVVMISRFDSPQIFAETVAKGQLAFNYGGFVAYRTQAWDLIGGEGEQRLVKRGLTTYTPDVWLRLGMGPLTFELEAVGIVGRIDDVSDVELTPDEEGNDAVTDPVDIFSYGAVARVGFRALEDKLRVGLEVGHASGDQWDGPQPGNIHVSAARPLPIGGQDTSIASFHFDPAYNVDMILFRELMGTITNATYVKPSLSYAITDEIGFNVRGILSFANVPVATPGNDALYGLELGGDIGYQKGGFFAGLSYGVLFPFGALNHPQNVAGQGGPGFGFGPDNSDTTIDNFGDASTAQTFQTRVVLRF